jgi:hypothetical protein
MSPQASPVYFWEAEVEIETNDLAFSPQTATEGRGALAKQIFTADWLHDDLIWFSPSKRLGGWLKAQLPLARSTYANQMAAVKVFPADSEEEYVSIAGVSDLIGGKTPLPKPSQLPKGLPVPFWTYINVPKELGTGTRVAPTFWFELHKPVKHHVRIMSFARGISPEIVKEALSKLGKAMGIGDKHSVGKGRFKLLKFEAKQEKLAL